MHPLSVLEDLARRLGEGVTPVARIVRVKHAALLPMRAGRNDGKIAAPHQPLAYFGYQSATVVVRAALDPDDLVDSLQTRHELLHLLVRQFVEHMAQDD